MLTARSRSQSVTATVTNSTASTNQSSPALDSALPAPTPDATYVEIVEIPSHPFFLGCQFHPEFKSKPLEPHPLFHAFIGASYQNRLTTLPAAESASMEQPIQ